MKNIELEDYQINEYKKSVRILSRRKGILNTSSTGTGKTYLSCKYAQEYNLPIIVICTKTCGIVWDKMSKEYDLKIDILSYEKLRGRRNCSMKNDLMIRDDYVNERDVKKTDFQISSYLKNKIQNGILFIVDEVHHIKNKTSDQSKAVHKIIDYINKSQNNSKFILLSATTFDVNKHSELFVRLFNFAKHNKMYDRNESEFKKMEMLGLREMIDECNILDPDTTFDILLNFINIFNVITDLSKIIEVKNKEEYNPKDLMLIYCNINRKLTLNTIIKNININKGISDILCYEFWKHIIIKNIGIYIELPETIYTHKKVNGFYMFLQDKEVKEYNSAIHYLVEQSHYDYITNTAIIDNENRFCIFNALKILELTKVPLFANLAEKYLVENNNNHVIIYLNYIESINTVTSLLKYNKPLVLHGKINNRDKIINEFNDPNNDRRLIIISRQVGKESISLHDTFGDHKRIMLDSPNFSVIDSVQCEGRINRNGTVSDSIFINIFGKTDFKYNENKIIKCLSDKLSVINSSAYDSKTDTYKTNTEYDVEIQNDKSDYYEIYNKKLCNEINDFKYDSYGFDTIKSIIKEYAKM